MSGARELKQLVLMIDEHRNNIGNSQFAFDLHSEIRDVVARFSNKANQIRQEACERIKYHWERSLRWDTDEPKKLVENTAIYAWSCVHQYSYNPPDEAKLRLLMTTDMAACLQMIDLKLSRVPFDTKDAVKDAAIHGFMNEYERIVAIIQERNAK